LKFGGAHCNSSSKLDSCSLARTFNSQFSIEKLPPGKKVIAYNRPSARIRSYVRPCGECNALVIRRKKRELNSLFSILNFQFLKNCQVPLAGFYSRFAPAHKTLNPKQELSQRLPLHQKFSPPFFFLLLNIF